MKVEKFKVLLYLKKNNRNDYLLKESILCCSANKYRK